MLEKALPNAMLKDRPNIESRIRFLKRDWSIVYDMLNGQNNSGFGWDDHRQVVVAEDAVWDSYLKSHKEAGQFRHRSFPYYDQLTAIYAKDRATGKDAQTVTDILEEINAEDVPTAGVPHLQRGKKKRILMQLVIFLLQLMMLPLYWLKTCGPLANKSVGVLPPMW
ncbi:hypothetical protein Gotur_020141 [Gossypium turneri]